MPPSETPTIFSCESALLIQVITQMEKEIEMSGEHYIFKSKIGQSLVIELAKYLSEIDTNGNIQNLLYRVDVDPHKIKTNEKYYIAISKALWNRVLQKVWFRNQFNTN